MFKKKWTLACALVALPGTGFAQLNHGKLQPMPSEARDAGTYHVATGTWSRGTSQAALAGPGVIYDNTCTIGYYLGLDDGSVLFDSGRIPSTTSPHNAESLTGWADRYTVESFTFAYCSFAPGPVDIDLSFADCYAACDTQGNLPEPTAVFHMLNAPGAAAGIPACWVINVNLANTTMEFDLGGDCDGVFDDNPSDDSFGWSWSQVSPSVGGDGGPLLAGDPAGIFGQSGQSCGGPGAGTSFVGAGPGPGSGIGILDQMEIGNGPTPPGCYWLGGYGGTNPFTAFYMQLSGSASTNAPDNNGASYCVGTGCPCANNSQGVGGCRNSGLYGARLMGTGNASMLPGEDSLEFHIYNVNGARPGLLLRGDMQVNGGLGNPVGDGLFCTTGNTQRSQVIITTPLGTGHFPNWNGAGFASVANAGTPTNFQFWYRDDPGASCGGGFNFSNAWTVTY